MSKGRIVFLDGASSSGKGSMAVDLCIDDYLGEFREGRWDNKQATQQRWSQIVSDIHAAAAAAARAGNSIIVDDVLEENLPWVENLLALFYDLEVVFVGVHCPLEELERREKARGDRRKRMSRLQFDQVHSQAIYDGHPCQLCSPALPAGASVCGSVTAEGTAPPLVSLHPHTSILSPEECASAIVDRMGMVHHSSAFERLRSRFKRARGTDVRNQDQVTGTIEW